MPLNLLRDDLSRFGADAGLAGSGLGLFAMVTQSEIATWAGGLTVLGGSILWIIDKYRRNAIKTGSLERDAILSDARAEIRDLRVELHESRDALNETRIKLALAEARLAGQLPMPAPIIKPTS